MTILIDAVKEAGQDIVLNDLTIRIINVPMDQSMDVEYYRTKYLSAKDDVAKVNAELAQVQDTLIDLRDTNAVLIAAIYGGSDAGMATDPEGMIQ